LEGSGAPSLSSYQAALGKTADILSALRQARADGSLELLTIASRKDNLKAAADLASSLSRDSDDIFVLGTGGSSLGAQALADLAPRMGQRPRLHFCDNLDGLSFAGLLESYDLSRARFVAVSKSGGTPETMMQTLAAFDALRRAGLGGQLKDHFAIVTEPKKSALRTFGESIGCPMLDHPVGIGGRYSVLSVVGLLPALLMKLDAGAIREGALSVLDQAFAGGDTAAVPAASGAALHWALAQDGRLRETVLWPYADRLKTFGAWWRQLWAESLGKEGQGSTPVSALGPVDQHSQLQLFLDGPGGALFTVVSTDSVGQGPVMPKEEAEKLGLHYLAGRAIGDLVDAEARATGETLARRGRPVRRLHVPVVDERSLGALLMHFMLETIIMGRLMGIDPFDQPAVEEGKILARTYLESRKG
jgi:glucose-6-phosphate isomerase